jgi:hypothetical protein
VAIGMSSISGSSRPQRSEAFLAQGESMADVTAAEQAEFNIHQDAFARFRETIFWARSMKARKLAAMWRRPG